MGTKLQITAQKEYKHYRIHIYYINHGEINQSPI